jgi:hypothetical protein
MERSMMIPLLAAGPFESGGPNTCSEGLAGGNGTGSMARTDLDSFDPNRSLRNS